MVSRHSRQFVFPSSFSNKRDQKAYAEGYAKIDRKKKREARKDLRSRSLPPMEETQEHLLRANKLLGNEMRRIGLRPRTFPESQVFFLSQAAFAEVAEKVKSSDASGYYTSADDAVVIDYERSKASQRGLFAVIVHELAHALSRTTSILNYEARKTVLSQTGYGLWTPESKEGVVHGHGLNEAVTDKITREVLGLPSDSIDEMNREDGLGWHHYNYYILTLVSVMEALAKKVGSTKEKVWERFKRGYFTGSTPHFVQLNRVFGPDSRAVLELMGARMEHWGKNPESKVLLKIRDYFQEDDSGIRQSLADEMLGRKPE